MVIDWSEVPSKFKFAAKDPSGQIFVYENKPRMSTSYRVWQNTGKGCYGRAGKCHNSTISWVSSLTERPSTVENTSAFDIGVEVHSAIESLLNSTKDKIPKMLGGLLDEDKLFEMIPDELFEAYLTGWLSAKGMSLEGLDLTKSGNWKQPESK